MRKPVDWNAPIKLVLKELKSNDKSVVCQALRQLRQRFIGLDKRDQLQVLIHHLNGNKNCRKWAYGKLIDLWDDAFEPIITQLWNQYHEERCAWAIINHFPLEYVIENEEALSIGNNRKFVVRRLCDDVTYQINETSLSTSDYVWVLSYTGRSISDDKAKWILIDIVKAISANRADSIAVIDYTMGFTFSATLNKVIFHLVKMGKGEVVSVFLKWYQQATKGMKGMDTTYELYNIYAETLHKSISDLEIAFWGEASKETENDIQRNIDTLLLLNESERNMMKEDEDLVN